MTNFSFHKRKLLWILPCQHSLWMPCEVKGPRIALVEYQGMDQRPVWIQVPIERIQCCNLDCLLSRYHQSLEEQSRLLVLPKEQFQLQVTFPCKSELITWVLYESLFTIRASKCLWAFEDIQWAVWWLQLLPSFSLWVHSLSEYLQAK